MKRTKRQEIHRRSLLAAASVVLALGAGCIETGDDTAAASGSGETASAYADGSEPICLDVVDMEAYTECCDARAAWCDETFPEALFDECLFGSDLSGSTGCIPWGPAAPPVFRAGVA